MSALSTTREENFPNWYQEVIKPLAEHGQVKGTQVIKPWGYGVWELIQQNLDYRIKHEGCENFYCPLFMGMDAISQEAKHIEGFAKECAVVTHGRLAMKDGQLVPDGQLTAPVIIRPTSEAIIGPIVKNWIHSYRDLPMKLNQWANVVRWEMRTRLFLRSSEFLWQEGHTFHASAEEANQMAQSMAQVYANFFKDMLALPAILGEKSELERFAGAEQTYTLELLMQDGKALQGGTSHDLGQNFAKAYDIQFTDPSGSLSHCYGSSFGVTTRMIGALAMVHGDDDGLCLPPRVATTQVVILPINPKDDDVVRANIEDIAQQLAQLVYANHPLRVKIDDRKLRGGAKAWDWVRKGCPLRIEIGPRDLEKQQITVSRRDESYQTKHQVSLANLDQVVAMLEEMQSHLYHKAEQFLLDHIYEVTSLEELLAHFANAKSGFVKVPYAGEAEDEASLHQHQLSIRCLQTARKQICIFTGKETNQVAYIAKAY